MKTYYLNSTFFEFVLPVRRKFVNSSKKCSATTNCAIDLGNSCVHIYSSAQQL